MSESISTTCVQGGYRPGDGEPRQIPIYQSTTWKYDTSEHMGRLFDLEEAGYFYEDTSDRIMDDDVLARLLSFNNVIMTSHQGFFTREALDNIAHTTLQNINDFDKHRKLVNEVRAEPEKAIG